MTNRLVLIRLVALSDRTLGALNVYDGAQSVCPLFSLELPWRGNTRHVSCIPAGAYKISPEMTARLGWVLRLHNVPDRDGVLVHAGNYPSNTEGCVLAAMTLADINGDGIADASRSRVAMERLRALITDVSQLTIVEAF
jgi:hypothetical protein